MVLFSKETEEEALNLVRNRHHNFEDAFNIFQQTTKKVFGNQKVYALDDIEEGRKITGSQVGLKESNEDGVTGLDRYKVTGLTTKNFIPKNSIIKWEDLSYSYQQIRAR